MLEKNKANALQNTNILRRNFGSIFGLLMLILKFYISLQNL